MARVIFGGLSREDREAFAVLLTPFLILAAVIAMSVGTRLERAVAPMLDGREQSVAARPLLPPRPATAITSAAPADALIEAQGTAERLPPASFAVDPAVTASGPVMSAARPVTEKAAEIRGPDVPTIAETTAPPPLGLTAAPAIAALATPADQTAILDQSAVTTLKVARDSPPVVTARLESGLADDARCSVLPASSARHEPADGSRATRPMYGAEFGRLLSSAAMRQLDQFTIYNDAYRRISYPMGDVAALYGVCTDVIIRAYRDLGVDLQVAVQKARVGSGDTNIDHRRTETLRRFFQRAGQNLPVSTFAEDYAPGDIVTYDRPQNSGSRSHIAVVTDVVGPSGAPMIVHNRGWGAQLEDGLFVDRITGHYRYSPNSDAPRLAATPSPDLPAAETDRLSQPVLRPAKARRADVAKAPRQAERQRLPKAAATAAESAAAVTQANMMGGPVRR